MMRSLGQTMTRMSVLLAVVGFGLGLITVSEARAEECGSQQETRFVTLKWKALPETTPGESLIVDFAIAGAGKMQTLQVHASPFFKDSGKISRSKSSPEQLQSYDQAGSYRFEVPVASQAADRKISVAAVLFGKSYARLKVRYSLESVDDSGNPVVIEDELDANRVGSTVSKSHSIRY